MYYMIIQNVVMYVLYVLFYAEEEEMGGVDHKSITVASPVNFPLP